MRMRRVVAPLLCWRAGNAASVASLCDSVAISMPTWKSPWFSRCPFFPVAIDLPSSTVLSLSVSNLLGAPVPISFPW